MSKSDPDYRQDDRRRPDHKSGGDHALTALSQRLAEARRAGEPAPAELERLVTLLSQSGYAPGERLTSALDGLARWSGAAMTPATPADRAGSASQDRGASAAATLPPVPEELERKLLDFARTLGERPQTPAAAYPAAPSPASSPAPASARAAAYPAASSPASPDASAPAPAASRAPAPASGSSYVASNPIAPAPETPKTFGSKPQTPPTASLREALAAISARQKVLDDDVPAILPQRPSLTQSAEPYRPSWSFEARKAEAPAGRPEPAAPEPARVETAHAKPRPAPAEARPPRPAEARPLASERASGAVVGELRHEIERLNRAVGDLPTRARIDGLSREMAELAGRLAADRPVRLDPKSLSAIDALVSQVDRMRGDVASPQTIVDLAEELHAITSRLDALGPKSSAATDALARRIDSVRSDLDQFPRAAAVDGIGDGVKSLIERLDAQSRVAHPTHEAVVGLSSQVEALDDKIMAVVGAAVERETTFGQVNAAIRAELEDMPRARAIDDLGRQIDVLTESLASRSAIGPALKAVEGLSGRIETLDDRIAALAGRRDGDAERMADAVRGEIAAVARPEALDAISRRIDELASRPDPTLGAIDLLSSKIDGVGGRIESVASATRARDAAFQQIEKVAADLIGRQSQQSAEIVGALSSRIDELASRPDPALGAIHLLTSKIDGVGGRIESVSSATRARDAAFQQIEKVAAELLARQPEQSAEIVGALSGRLDGLGGRLDAVASAAQESGLASERIEMSVRAIAEQMIATQDRLEHQGPSALEAEVARVVENLERGDERLEDLHSAFAGLAVRIERSCADLGAHCVESAVAAARDALGGEAQEGRLDKEIVRALDELRGSALQSERRSADALDAVRSTLEQLLVRMEDRAAIAPPAPLIHAPSQRSEPARPEPRFAVADSQPDATEAARAAARRALEEMAGAKETPAPIMPRMPRVETTFERYADFEPDHPIEPGSTSPRIEPGAAQTAAAFIAAARRNAVLSATDAPSETEVEAEPDGPSQPSRFASLVSALKTRRRTLALGVVAAMIVFAALYAASGMTEQGDEVAPEPQTRLEAAPQPQVQAQPKAEIPPQVLPQPKASAAEAAPTAPDAKAVASPQPPAAAAAPLAQTGPKTELTEPGRKAEPSPETTSSVAAIAPRAPARDLTDFAFSEPAKGAESWTTAEPAEPTVTGSIGKNAELSDRIGGPTLRLRAVSGDPSAQLEIADRLLEGRNVEADATAAAQWLERAAAQGLAPAQHRLGSLYEKGRGVSRDVQAARGWYEKAASLGNVRAMHNLGVVHAEGGLGKPDFAAAAVWFRMSAERGLVDSQYNLAVLCARGLGGKRDLVEAYKWFSLAADQGDKDAVGKRDEVGKALGSSLGSAKTVVERFTPQPVDAAANDSPVPAGGWDRVAETKEDRPR